ncbi:hypothetical protein DPMN_090645 [Dreissena polymorpha]|uniref:Uncharacterized protein n=1 Tax=Dreissena polymorpha TaxID=45954 RepID=A0A9D4KYG4_DREPO|nr:hypothetical protein DPMN_090645 [Dreissena polymorpha]
MESSRRFMPDAATLPLLTQPLTPVCRPTSRRISVICLSSGRVPQTTMPTN